MSAFFAGLGMRILDIYGMTETTGAFTSNTVSEFRMGSVGRASLAGTEIMIADDGEILTWGPLNTPGYLNRPDLDRGTDRRRRLAAHRGHRPHR